jgi:mRNA-degrading endonuclease RelE of RelBE toxin-antitoxin system
MRYGIWVPHRVEKQIAAMPKELITRVLDDLEGFADGLDYRRYDVRKVRGSPKDVPRYRMRSGNYRVTFFIHHNRLVIELISIRGKKTGMEY